MDFNHLEIKRFVLDSIPNQFNDLSPVDFDSFIAHLLKLDGYAVERITVSNESHASFQAKKDDASVVFRVIRSRPEYLIGTEAVRQAVQAREIHQTDQS